MASIEIMMSYIYLRKIQKKTLVRTNGKPSIKNRGTIEIGKYTLIRSSHIPIELATDKGATLKIGENSRINFGTSIGATKSVEIGKNVRIGPLSIIVDSDFHKASKRNERPIPKGVKINDNVWIGARTTILKGVEIGEWSIIGAGSVVTKSVPPFSVYAGNPAILIGKVEHHESDNRP